MAEKKFWGGCAGCTVLQKTVFLLVREARSTHLETHLEFVVEVDVRFEVDERRNFGPEVQTRLERRRVDAQRALQ